MNRILEDESTEELYDEDSSELLGTLPELGSPYFKATRLERPGGFYEDLEAKVDAQLAVEEDEELLESILLDSLDENFNE